jgi:septum site-determining protein MinD
MAQKIVVASGKGGVGKSSAVCGLCRCLADMGKKVLVIDFDIGLRGLDLIFGVSSQVVFDWGDVILGRCELDKAFIYADGATLIAAPRAFSDEFTKDNISELLGQLDTIFDYILLDAPAGISKGLYLAACCADRALIVSTPDNVCVRCGSLTADKLLEIGISDIRLIINRFSRRPVMQRRLLNIDDVIDAAGVQLIGVVPEDPEVMYSLSNGERLSGKSFAREAFMKIAGRICGENIPLDLSALP